MSDEHLPKHVKQEQAEERAAVEELALAKDKIAKLKQQVEKERTKALLNTLTAAGFLLALLAWTAALQWLVIANIHLFRTLFLGG